jgi:hypothetical protein
MSPDEVERATGCMQPTTCLADSVPIEEYLHLFMRNCAISFSRNRSRKLLGAGKVLGRLEFTAIGTERPRYSPATRRGGSRLTVVRFASQDHLGLPRLLG